MAGGTGAEPSCSMAIREEPTFCLEGDTMASIVEANSLFEIDSELDGLLEQIEEQVQSEGHASQDFVARFQQFCEAHGEKVDRIGRFVRMMEAREQHCRNESARLADRARAAAGKVERTKNMVLYYLLSRDLKRIEGYQFTLRAQKNSQDSVRITDEAAVPMSYCKIDARIDGVVWETVLSLLPDELSKSLESSVQEIRPNADAIKAAAMRNEQVPGAEIRRSSHLRVA
jgi:hypothetical protein